MYRAKGRQSNTKIHFDTGTCNKLETVPKLVTRQFKKKKKKLVFPFYFLTVAKV